MRKSPVLLLAAGAAVALAGLGHYYLLYLRVYAAKAAISYAIAAVLMLWVFTRVKAPDERLWDWIRLAWQELRVSLSEELPEESDRIRLAIVAAANAIAAIVALWVDPPMALLVAACLWAVAVVALAGFLPPIDVRAGLFYARPIAAVKAWHDRYRPILAAGGWLLLAAGWWVLRLRTLPPLLERLDRWLIPRLEDFRLNVPIASGAWFTGSVLLVLGLIVLAATRGGTTAFPRTLPISGTQRLPSLSHLPLGRRWGVLVLASTSICLWLAHSVMASRTASSVILFWLVALTIQALYWWQADRGRDVSIVPKRGSLATYALLAAALAMAFVITAYRLEDIPDSVWGDEGAFWFLARDLAQGARRNPFDLGVYSVFPVMGSLYQSVWIRVFGPGLWSWRFGSVVAGTMTIVPLFFLAQRLFGTRVAWSSVVLLISLPYFLAYTRMGYNVIQPLLPVTLGMLLLVGGLERGSQFLLYMAGIAYGLASLTYMSGHMGLVLGWLVCLFVLIRQWSLRRVTFRLGLAMSNGWFLAAGPLVLGGLLSRKPLGAKVLESFIGNSFYGQAVFSMSEITQRYPVWQFGQQGVFFEPRLYGLLLGRGLVRTVLSIVAHPVKMQHYLVGPLAGPSVVFCLAGLGWALGSYRRLHATLWVLWATVCVAMLSVLNAFPPCPTHMSVAIPALAVLAAAGIWLLSGLISRYVSRIWSDCLGIILTVVLALSGLHSYFVEMPRQYAPNLENVMFWRAREMERGSNVVFVIGPPYRSEFRVWEIDEFDLGVGYHGIPVGQVQASDLRAACGQACRVFFLPEDADIVTRELLAQLGEGTLRKHYDAEGRIIGWEFEPP